MERAGWEECGHHPLPSPWPGWASCFASCPQGLDLKIRRGEAKITHSGTPKPEFCLGEDLAFLSLALVLGRIFQSRQDDAETQGDL